jgi:hypothetical protein
MAFGGRTAMAVRHLRLAMALGSRLTMAVRHRERGSDKRHSRNQSERNQQSLHPSLLCQSPFWGSYVRYRPKPS